MDGYTAAADDPVWATWTPACGHRCRCRRIALTERQAARYREQDAKRQADPEAAAERANAIAVGPDKGWGYDPYRKPNEGLKSAIERRRGQCGEGRLAVGSGRLCGPALDELVAGLEPRAIADELRERLGARQWSRLEAASRAEAARYGLAPEQGVALSAYTDRGLGEVINATARAMSTLADAVPADAALGAWLITAMDAGLTRLPALAGVAWRGVSVRGPGDGLPEDLAARWEAAHRPGRDVQYYGYTSLMAEEGHQYPGDWQLAVYAMSARDLSGLTVAAEPELLIPRKTVFRYLGFAGGYRILEEKAMKPVKPNRQFATPPDQPAESSVDDLRRAGASETALAALLPAVERAARHRAEWEASGRPGLKEMEASVQRATDRAFAGMPGYARNDVLGIFGPKNETPRQTL